MQDGFTSSQVSVDLQVVQVRRGVRGARGRMKMPREVLSRMLDPQTSAAFEFQDESGVRFNLLATKTDVLDGLCDVSSSGRVPGLRE